MFWSYWFYCLNGWLYRCHVNMAVTVGKGEHYIKRWFSHLSLISYLSLSSIDALQAFLPDLSLATQTC